MNKKQTYSEEPTQYNIPMIEKESIGAEDQIEKSARMVLKKIGDSWGNLIRRESY